MGVRWWFGELGFCMFHKSLKQTQEVRWIPSNSETKRTNFRNVHAFWGQIHESSRDATQINSKSGHKLKGFRDIKPLDETFKCKNARNALKTRRNPKPQALKLT